MLGELSNPWWAFIFLGIFAGLASGLLGIGGGVIMVPALVLIMATFDQKNAQGTALAAMVPIAIVGTARYMQNPDVTIDWVVVMLIVVGAVAGTLMGTELVARLPLGFLRKLFAILLVAVALKMFFSKPMQKPDQTLHHQQQTNQTPANEE